MDFFEKAKKITLAEKLITLGIIGIIATLTIPILLSKYNETITVAKVKDYVQLVTVISVLLMTEEVLLLIF